MSELRQLDDGIWVADAPMHFCGVAVGTRMTVVRLSDGKLWLHSPIEATGELAATVKALGDVAFLVAPNRFHHVFVDGWQTLCPDARTFAAPGLDRKRPDLAIDEVLGDEPPDDWAETLDQVRVRGMPMISEVVFFHRSSATLLLTDLAFNFQPDAPMLTRWVLRVIGRVGTLAPTLLEKMLTRDRSALAASLEDVLAMPFERVVVTHGDIVEQGGREQLVAGYDWALR